MIEPAQIDKINQKKIVIVLFSIGTSFRIFSFVQRILQSKKDSDP